MPPPLRQPPTTFAGHRRRRGCGRDWRLWLATGLGSGLSPVAPGTVGSLAAWPLAWWLAHWPFGWGALGVVVASVIGGWLSAHAVAVWRQEDVSQEDSSEVDSADLDPGAVVIDEWAGLMLAFWLYALGNGAPGWLEAVALLVAFRGFDIVKPGPVGWCDRRLKGGLGIMADDLVAGVLAAGLVSLGAWAMTYGLG